MNENNYDAVVIKGKFKFINKNIYSIFAIMINLETKSFMNSWVFSSYFKDMYDTDINKPWGILEQHFNQLQLTGNFAESVTVSMRKAIHEHLIKDQHFISMLIEDSVMNNTKNIQNIMVSILGIIEKKSALSVEVVAEKINLDELKQKQKEQKLFENKGQDSPSNIHNDMDTLKNNSSKLDIDSNALSIPAHPIFAPFYNSVLVQQLKKEDKILMLIDDSSEYGKKCAELLGVYDKSQKKIYPLIGNVSQIIKNSNNTLTILVLYNNTQYSKFNVEEGVKLKMYDPNSPEIVINASEHSNIHEQTIDLEDVSINGMLSDPYFIKLLIIIIVCLMSTILAIIFV